jgi:type IV secretory pathway VirB9-like protein
MSQSSSTPYLVRRLSRPSAPYTLGVFVTTLVSAGSAHGQASNGSISPAPQVAARAATAAARIVPAGHFVTVPFGHSEPVLTCTVLRVCIIELEDRELVVNEPIAGDQARWIITSARSGPDGRNTLIVVKPKQCDITTNIVIPTDRRIYDLALDSPPCSGRGTNPRQAFVRHVRFSYPDDSGAGRTATEGARPGTADNANGDGAAGQAPSPTTTAADSAVAPVLNRDYRVRRERHGLFGLFRRKRIDFPWRPVAIYDDGVRVSLVLPAEARHTAAPVLYALEDDGSRTLVNYTVRDSAEAVVYVADRTFRRGVLVVPNGSREQRLEFENRQWGKPAGRDD